MAEIRDHFQSIVTGGGWLSSLFLLDERRGAGQRVRDCAGRVRDQLLKRALTEVAGAWDAAFGHAPGERGARVYSLDNPGEYREEDRIEREKLDKQVEEARNGLVACANALDRLNQLDR